MSGETGPKLIVEAEIPDITLEETDLVVTEDGLTIRGDVKEEQRADDNGLLRVERR